MAAFTAWCASVGRRPLPATPETVTEYVAHLTVTPSPQTGRPLAPGSINRVLTAVRAAHRADAAPAPETEGARKVLSGYRKRLAAANGRAEARAARPRRAGPSTPDALREMLATLDQDTLIGKRDAALLLLGYACTAHVSELVSLDQADAVETNAGLLVTLYRRPLKRHDKVAVPYGPIPATCPVWAAARRAERQGAHQWAAVRPYRWPRPHHPSNDPSRPERRGPVRPHHPYRRGRHRHPRCHARRLRGAVDWPLPAPRVSTPPPAAPAERRSRRPSRRSRGAGSATGGGRRVRC
ncbi:hypothetical protein FHX80_114928 [Streptomyces brevispora]|uniref:Core-binding (CB) domain-containing protein n=1 Tax=Streptomyces brevispora TaxID=887462 RepID=A0A561V4C5_9ACTN|nr:hypothetical protein FHX80_114928 [Streptomyces brevispora]